MKHPKDACEACAGVGILHAENDVHGFRIERCDACAKYASDAEAVVRAFICAAACEGIGNPAIIPELIKALEQIRDLNPGTYAHDIAEMNAERWEIADKMLDKLKQ